MKYAAAAVLMLAACGSGAVERVAIPPGSTIHAAADSLSAHGVIWSRPWFLALARWHGGRGTLHAGVYQFHRGAATLSVLHALRSGAAMHFRVTVIPGGTLYDLARNVQRELGIPADSTLAAAHDSAVLRPLQIPASSAEGWLLPESFDFGGFDTAGEIVTRFVRAREQAWPAAWDTAAASAHLDREGLLTLASIVEAEAHDTADLPLIAAVYRNRLRIRMPLQADPTVEYAYLLQTGARKGRLYDADYQLRSPWNTYLRPGLPPGPIDNPPRAAIEAVLHPANVRYLYFVAGPDGRSVFASTYAEQLRNIRRLRQQM